MLPQPRRTSGWWFSCVRHDRDRVEQAHRAREVRRRERPDELVLRARTPCRRARSRSRPARGCCADRPCAPSSRRSRDHAIVSASPGSRRIRPMSARKREPCSPSTSRWSNDRLERHDLAQRDLAPVLPRLPAHGAHREDRRLPGVEDRRARVDAEDADVRDRDRAAGEVGGAACVRRAPCRRARRSRRRAR